VIFMTKKEKEIQKSLKPYNNRIKREKWRGKYRLVQRNYRGKIISSIKWSPKLDKEKLRETFKTNNTLREGLKVVELGGMKPGTNFAEFVVSKKKGRVRPPKNMRFQYFVTIRLDKWKRKEITGRTPKRHFQLSIASLRQEALENALLRATQHRDGAYDEDAAERIAESERYTIVDEGIVYYRLI